MVYPEHFMDKSGFSSSRSRRRERRKESRRQCNGSSEEIVHPKKTHENLQQSPDDPVYASKNNHIIDSGNLMGMETDKFVANSSNCVLSDDNTKHFFFTKNDKQSAESSSTVRTCCLTSSDLSDMALHTEGAKEDSKKKVKRKKPKRKRTRKKKYLRVSEAMKKRYVALDCEMVGIGYGGITSAVARVSIVNWDGNIMLDTFVRVPQQVTDYRTSISGIRPCDIESEESMELQDCQEIVRDIIKDKILVGHALKNDMQALSISHPWHKTRDTAKYEPFMRDCKQGYGLFRARKLKELAQEFLGLDIQQDGSEHDPVVDAWVAMELYKLMRKQWEKCMEWKQKMTKQIEKKSYTKIQ